MGDGTETPPRTMTSAKGQQEGDVARPSKSPRAPKNGAK